MLFLQCPIEPDRSSIIPHAETWDDPIEEADAMSGSSYTSDVPPSDPSCLTSPPSSWLSAALDFKNHLTIPSLSSFKPLLNVERGGDADGRAR